MAVRLKQKFSIILNVVIIIALFANSSIGRYPLWVSVLLSLGIVAMTWKNIKDSKK